MTDITTKLQSLARWLRHLAANEPEPECKASHIECAEDCIEAGGEIHRLNMKASAKDVEISSLRAELAGYVEANKHMKGELDDALEDARKYCEAQGEIARLEDQMACLKEFRMDGLGVDMRWSGDAANALMRMLAAMMLDVPNYLESTLTIAGHGESYVMTIRKHDGKTPHAMRAEADAEIARLRDALSAVFQYGSDTLSGPVGEPDDRKWQRAGVLEMTRRARAALAQVAEVPE